MNDQGPNEATIASLPRAEEFRQKRQRMQELANVCGLISDNSLSRNQRARIQELKERLDFRHAELMLDHEIAFVDERIEIFQKVLDIAKEK